MPELSQHLLFQTDLWNEPIPTFTPPTRECVQCHNETLADIAIYSRDNNEPYHPECYDEILVPSKYMDDAAVIMHDVISMELPGFKIVISLTREYQG